MKTIINQKTNQRSFTDIIAPISFKEFSSKYWDKEVLLLQREDPTFFSSLISIKDLDTILQISRPKGGEIRVVKNQVPLDKTKYEEPDGGLNLNQIYAAYSDGHTIVINEINKFWNHLTKLCANLTQELGHKTVANLYLTPKHQTALSPHYDTHDVFVIQVEGEKHWKLYDMEYPTPLVNSFQPIFKRENLKNERNIVMKAGDVMYIPRGVPHEASTGNCSSLHLTLGVYATQYLDLFIKNLQFMAQNEVALRKALPLNFNKQNEKVLKNFTVCFEKIKEELVQDTTFTFAKALLSEDQRSRNTSPADGHFKSLDHLDEITMDTQVQKREFTNCSVQVTPTFARILFAGNVIKGPAAIAPIFQYITDTPGLFTVSELPLGSNENKIKIVKRLIRGGLLQVILE